MGAQTFQSPLKKLEVPIDYDTAAIQQQREANAAQAARAQRFVN
jgi:hypothetical protein